LNVYFNIWQFRVSAWIRRRGRREEKEEVRN
jgi:hypothetical protein